MDIAKGVSYASDELITATKLHNSVDLASLSNWQQPDLGPSYEMVSRTLPGTATIGDSYVDDDRRLKIFYQPGGSATVNFFDPVGTHRSINGSTATIEPGDWLYFARGTTWDGNTILLSSPDAAIGITDADKFQRAGVALEVAAPSEEVTFVYKGKVIAKVNNNNVASSAGFHAVYPASNATGACGTATTGALDEAFNSWGKLLENVGASSANQTAWVYVR